MVENRVIKFTLRDYFLDSHHSVWDNVCESPLMLSFVIVKYLLICNFLFQVSITQVRTLTHNFVSKREENAPDLLPL